MVRLCPCPWYFHFLHIRSASFFRIFVPVSFLLARGSRSPWAAGLVVHAWSWRSPPPEAADGCRSRGVVPRGTRAATRRDESVRCQVGCGAGVLFAALTRPMGCWAGGGGRGGGAEDSGIDGVVTSSNWDEQVQVAWNVRGERCEVGKKQVSVGPHCK